MTGSMVRFAVLSILVCRALGFSLSTSSMIRARAADFDRAMAARAELQTGSGCFFWEKGVCKTAWTMCGSDAVLGGSTKDNQCKKFIFSFNHAYEECFPPTGHPSDNGNLTADNFRNCFFASLRAHLPAREYCPSTCQHSHEPSNVGGLCFGNCLHIHHCVDECNSDKFKYREAIEDCLSDCAALSPVSGEPTCRESCGTHSANRECWCDPTCLYTGDCCKDFTNYCQGGLQDPVNTTLPMPNETEKLPPMNVSLAKNYKSPLFVEASTIGTTEVGIDVGIDDVKLDPPTSPPEDAATVQEAVAEYDKAEEAAGGGYSPAATVYSPGASDNVFTPEDVLDGGAAVLLADSGVQRLRSYHRRS